MIRVGIQADDLTGACDTGAVFAARGLPTVVLLPDAALPAPAPAVLVLDTESRQLPHPEARARARAGAARLAAAGPGRVYKKVDSTLRGAQAAELAGVLEGAGRPRAVLAPAFPAQGRTVVDGILRIGGRPAGETAIARDPAFPPTGPSAVAVLGRDGPHPVSLVPLVTVRRGAPAVAARLGRYAGAFVCDAETAADLDAVAAAAEATGTLLAGSAGLAAALAARLAAGRPPAPVRVRPPLFVVSGSAHPATHAQLARLEAGGARGCWVGSEDDGRGVAADDAFLAARPEAASGDPARRQGMADRLAALVRRRLETARPGTLLLTGGETAFSVCRALAATGITLAGELEPGLAVGELRGGPFAAFPVITKAGGFGDAETLARVAEAARR